MTVEARDRVMYSRLVTSVCARTHFRCVCNILVHDEYEKEKRKKNTRMHGCFWVADTSEIVGSVIRYTARTFTRV